MDAWRLYEDVCLACAGLWTGRAWRNHPGSEEDEAEAEEYGFTDDPVRVRAHGEGIEGRPMTATVDSAQTTSQSYRRVSKRYLPSPWTAAPSTQDDAPKDMYNDDDDDDDDADDGVEDEEGEEEGAVLVHNRQSRTTLALLQTFHAQTRFWLSRLATLLPLPPASETLIDTDADVVLEGQCERAAEKAVVIQLAPRDVLELELSPLSGLDARFVEWLAEEYCARAGVRVSVRRGWRDLFGLVFASGGGGASPSSSSSR